MDKGIRLEDLKVGYGTSIVLNNVNIDILPGEIVCLIGANGAGKSTVLKTIVRQLKKLGGSIIIDGHQFLSHASCFCTVYRSGTD